LTNMTMLSLLVGDSNVKRFGAYMSDAAHSFECQNVVLRCHGVSGGRFTRASCTASLESVIEAQRPERLLVFLGGNDLDDTHVHESDIQCLVLRLVALVSQWQRKFAISCVFVCQLVPRQTTRHVPVETYNHLIQLFNQSLKQELKGQNQVLYWKLKGMKQSTAPVLQTDGVHFNRYGMQKFRRIVRGMLLHKRVR